MSQRPRTKLMSSLRAVMQVIKVGKFDPISFFIKNCQRPKILCQSYGAAVEPEDCDSVCGRFVGSWYTVMVTSVTAAAGCGGKARPNLCQEGESFLPDLTRPI